MQHVRAVGAEQGAVARILHDPLVEALDHREEFVDIVGLGVERILLLGQRRQAVLQHAGDRGQGGRLGQEPQIAVAALEADLLLVHDAQGRELGARDRGIDIGQTVDEAAGVAAPADRFAVGVEDHQLDRAHALRRQRPADRASELLDRVGGRDLAEGAAGIGIAGLDAHPAMAAQIIPVARHLERLGDHPGTLLQPGQALEQRRDLDLLGDPEQLGEIERGQEREAGLAFGDQEAHRLGRVDIFQDLGDDHEDPARGRPLGDQRAEIDPGRLDLLDQGADRVQIAQAMAGIVRAVVHPQGLADRVVQLAGVQAGMGVRHAEAVGPDLGAQHQKAVAQRRIVARRQGALDQLDQLAGIDQPGRAAGMHRPGGARQLGRPALGARGPRALLEHQDLVVGLLDRQGEPRRQQLQQVAQPGIAGDQCAQGARLLEIALQLQHLDPQALGEGHGPGNVGAAVQVVADPAGNRQKPGAELVPALRIDLLGDLEHQAIHLVQDLVQIGDRHQRLAVLLVQIERPGGAVLAPADLVQEALAAGGAGRPALAVQAERQLDQGVLQGLRQGEGRVRGDHDAEAVALDLLGKRLERQLRPGRGILGQRQDRLAQPCAIGGRIGLAQIGADMLGAMDEGRGGQPLHQLLQAGQGQFAPGQLLLQLDAQELDRIAERIGRLLRLQLGQAGAQQLAQRGRIDAVDRAEADRILRHFRLGRRLGAAVAGTGRARRHDR